ncbi:hypothetical protein KCP69_26275 [Salmonella enterica subsp. enterica]|nr:hypothetical protein KCP69_26275 [Salmonella enterica subsp. enterica]
MKSRKTTLQQKNGTDTVIGDRPVKATESGGRRGKVGGRAVVVPGVAADMKLGDDESGNATFRHFILRQRRRGR